MVSLDSSYLLALLDHTEPMHRVALATIRREPGPYIVPVGILGEIAYLVESRLGNDLLCAFLDDLERGRFTLDCGEQDLGRIGHLVDRYADLPLGFADACVIACAERNGGRVLTLDYRDFEIVAREGTIEIVR